MQVLSNLASMFGLGNLNRAKKKQSDSMEKLATGEAFPSARYGAESYAISEKMRVQIRVLDQNDDNVKAGGDLLRTAEGALQSQLNIMRQIKEKVIDAANDTNTDQDRVTIQKEIDQLYKQFEDITHSTRYNGIQLLTGGVSPYKTVEGEWTRLDEPVMLEESAAMNVIPDNYATLDGIEGPFDIFTEYQAGVTTTISTLDIPQPYSGGGGFYSVSASSISALDDHCISYSGRRYVFTSDPSRTYPTSYTYISGGRIYNTSNSLILIDLNTYNTVSAAYEQLASLAGITFDISTENGVTTAKTTSPIGSTSISQTAMSAVDSAPASGIGGGYFSGGVSAQQGDGIDIPTITAQYAKYTSNISGVAPNSGFSISGGSYGGRVEVLFVSGNSAPNLNQNTGRWEIGLDWTGTKDVGYHSLTIDSSKNLTILATSSGTSGNYCMVTDGLQSRPAQSAATSILRTIVSQQTNYAYAKIDLSNYNTTDSDKLEELISSLKNKNIRWYSGYSVEFVDSGIPGDFAGVPRTSGQFIDLANVRNAVHGGSTIAEAFSNAMKSLSSGGYLISTELDESGNITNLKFRSTTSGENGNYSSSRTYNRVTASTSGDLRHYEISYGAWFNSHPDFVVPDDLDGKGFRVYCATDANQWFNFIFRNGGAENIPESGSSDVLDYRTINIDVSEVTDANSLIQAIYNQGEPEMQDINHYMHLAMNLDEGKLVLYDQRAYTRSQLSSMTGVEYQERGAKIADGALDNVARIDKILYAKTLVIQDTEKSNSYITLHIPQMTFDHVFYSIPSPDTIYDYPVTSKSARTALLGPPEPGIIDQGIDYVLDAITEVGSQMQRLETSNSNIVTKRENAQSSESTIRNLDMAKEMIEQTKLNILANASQSMLAQSNQNLSNVLELIQ